MNRHNVPTWGAEQPHAQIEHQRDSPKVNIFCAVSREELHNIFFFAEATVTGDKIFGHVGKGWLLPQLNTNYDDYILKLDKAPPPFSQEWTSVSQLCSSTALDRTCCCK
jgi:hypothetical protein